MHCRRAYTAREPRYPFSPPGNEANHHSGGLTITAALMSDWFSPETGLIHFLCFSLSPFSLSLPSLRSDSVPLRTQRPKRVHLHPSAAYVAARNNWRIFLREAARVHACMACFLTALLTDGPVMGESGSANVSHASCSSSTVYTKRTLRRAVACNPRSA